MSDTLQEKLREIILGEKAEDIEPLDTRHLRVKRADVLVAQILQAFKEAGYIDASRLVKVSKLLAEQAELLATMTALPTYAELITESQKMTGQEFYGHFKAELEGGELMYDIESELQTNGGITMQDALEAARRAAGITENQGEQG